MILINPTDNEIAGQAAFSNQTGAAAPVFTDRGTSSVFNYRIPGRSSWRLQTSVAGNLQIGSVQLTGSPAGSEMPVAFLIFNYQYLGVTATSAGVPTVRSSSASRLFVQSSGNYSMAFNASNGTVGWSVNTALPTTLGIIQSASLICCPYQQS